MRRQFGKTIVKLAEKDKNIVLITGDVKQEMDEFINRLAAHLQSPLELLETSPSQASLL